jgi:hypothetical protein
MNPEHAPLQVRKCSQKNLCKAKSFGLKVVVLVKELTPITGETMNEKAMGTSPKR